MEVALRGATTASCWTAARRPPTTCCWPWPPANGTPGRHLPQRAEGRGIDGRVHLGSECSGSHVAGQCGGRVVPVPDPRPCASPPAPIVLRVVDPLPRGGAARSRSTRSSGTHCGCAPTGSSSVRSAAPRHREPGLRRAGIPLSVRVEAARTQRLVQSALTSSSIALTQLTRYSSLTLTLWPRSPAVLGAAVEAATRARTRAGGPAAAALDSAALPGISSRPPAMVSTIPSDVTALAIPRSVWVDQGCGNFPYMPVQMYPAPCGALA